MRKQTHPVPASGCVCFKKAGEESNHKGIEGMKQKMNLKSGMFNGLPAYACALLLLAAGLVLSVLYAVTVGSAELSDRKSVV